MLILCICAPTHTMLRCAALRCPALLQGLRYDTRPNPHCRTAAPMRLYSLLEVKGVALAKWGSWAAIEAARHKGQQRYSKARSTREANMEARQAEL
jgi:hypothetical protein